jgi:hypothetical protein
MNEEGESFPSTETQKKKRRSGFRYSSKKALDCSRVLRRSTRTRGSKLKSVTKALLYHTVLSSEISVIDHHNCAASLGGPLFVESVYKHDGEKMEICLNDSFSDGAFS